MVSKNGGSGTGNGKPAGGAPNGGPSAGASRSASPKMADLAITRKKPATLRSESSEQPPPLSICRNKHWKYISSYHGPWLQLPTEVLVIIANINFHAPAPRPIDPAVVFDILHVRTLVDEAANAAVKAASFETSALDAMSGGGGHSANPRLSRERKLRMREQAAQKLAQAYRVDEVACSVASMQGTSTLEDIGAAVLQRNPDSVDALYVDFFQEKIPSRHVAETTTLEPLMRVLDGASSGSGGAMKHVDLRPEVLRTCATVRVFLDDLDGAARDLTESLAESRHRRQQLHGDVPEQKQELDRRVARRAPDDASVPEKDRPSGLEAQLLFNRAAVYLSMACKAVPGCLPTEAAPTSTNGTNNNPKPAKDTTTPTATNGDSDAAAAAGEDKEQVEKRRLVKTYAKRALRDFTAFLDLLHYSPNLPVSVARDYNLYVEAAFQGQRPLRNPRPTTAVPSHTSYPLSQLFAAVPPPDLPDPSAPFSETCEFVTHHPLLEETLHQLLMAHCLAQTSAKEIQRHAHMAARLIRLADGYPIFQINHCAARVDWIEVLRLCPALFPAAMTSGYGAPGTPQTWDNLCEPPKWRSAAQRMADVAMAGSRPNVKLAAQIRRLKYSDAQAAEGAGEELKSWGDAVGRDLTPVTDRAGLVGRWVGDVPVVTGVVRRRKKGKKT